jgi:hypothetical protein
MQNDFIYIDRDGLESLVGFVRGTDMFGIPLQFATAFWRDDSRGEYAKLAIAESYGPKINACIKEQKQAGICFSSIQEAREKFNSDMRYYIDFTMELRLEAKDSTDAFYISTGYKDHCRIIMGMSTSKFVRDKYSIRMMLADAREFRIWGYLIDNPRGFQIKPHAVWMA